MITTGGVITVSSLLIVAIPDDLPNVPPTALARFRAKVSLFSNSASPLTLTVIVLLVSPGVNVVVPAIRSDGAKLSVPVVAR